MGAELVMLELLIITLLNQPITPPHNLTQTDRAIIELRKVVEIDDYIVYIGADKFKRKI